MSSLQYFSAKYIVEDSTHLHKDSVLIVQGDLVKDIVHIESLPEKNQRILMNLEKLLSAPGLLTRIRMLR